VEENIGFDTLEAIFLRSLDKECKLNIVDKGQLHYLFWHEIEETFENCEKQIAQQVIDIDYVLKTTPHHIDTNLDSIKYQSIGNKFDIKGDIPLYYQIL
jgi:hypothetical protein